MMLKKLQNAMLLSLRNNSAYGHAPHHPSMRIV